MDLSVVSDILNPYLEEHGLELYDVSLVKEFGYLILQVLVDKKGGIDVEELALVNEYLSERIEGYDSDMPEYMLEVSSPGAEKPLRNMDEIKNEIGSYIHVEMDGAVYEGNLEDCDDEAITMKINAKGRFKRVKIEHAKIKLIRLAVKL